MTSRPCREAGFQLLELVVALAIVVTLALIGVPSLLRASARLRVELAAHELVGVLRQSRAWAIRHQAYVAVKFHTGEGNVVEWALYRDGDGDGVRNADIGSGVDRAVTPRRRLAHMGAAVGFGFPPGPPPRDPADPRRRLGRRHDPVRFNRSDLASFGPLGTATPGSLYLTDGRRELAVVRVFNRTGKVRILVYDPRRESWR